ncbi:MAG: hydantoinase B/oxoprolinase family protein [Dehalococcoidia bacterium]
MDAVSLEIFKSLFSSVAEEMGALLGRTGLSANIKERRDFSCALFDAQGRMVAQAAHLPVHLGSMPASVAAAIEHVDLGPGDVAVLNDPYLGGTHLPDITLVMPVHVGGGGRSAIVGYVANRAHHADIGGASPGSMPLATEIYQEGLIIPPVKLAERGVIDQQLMALICRNVRTPEERRGDLTAQVACAQLGARRLVETVEKYGIGVVTDHMRGLLDYSEAMTREAIRRIPSGRYAFEDVLDGDGLTDEPVVIRVEVTIEGDTLTADFSGSAPQTSGPLNAVLAVTQSAVLYVVRCIAGESAPANHGCLAPVRIVAPAGSVVNASPPSAVSAGNVETSQRIVDVLLGALAQALAERIPAASQGTMNNLAFGGYDPVRRRPFAYYETIGGGMGARPGKDGEPAIHTHMTNTRNTPVEALEFEMPLRVREYRIRRGSGGSGRHVGGDGLRRSLEFLAEADCTIIADRRTSRPYGLAGGEAGTPGRNLVHRRGSAETDELPAKVRLVLRPGDVLTIETPGGGGWGEAGAPATPR